MVMPASVSTVSKTAVNWPARSPDQIPEHRRTLGQLEQQVPGLLGGPRPIGVGGDAKNVHAARLNLHNEQHVEPSQRHRVDVEEVDREHPGGLGAQELPPGGVVAAGRRTAVFGPV